jgi:hypothetical protein
MGDELGVKDGARRDQEIVMEPEVPAVLFAAEVVVAGKSGRREQLAEEFPVQCDLLLVEEVLPRVEAAVDEDLVAGEDGGEPKADGQAPKQY